MTKKRILLALSAIIAIVDILFVYINYRFTHENLDASLREEAGRNYAAFTVSVNQMYANLLMVATLYAEDPKIQELFANGVKAVNEESGGPGPGGSVAAYWRTKLFEEVGQSWLKASQDFKVRQLHFHLGPGSTSYLRVHRAEKFGDNMDNVRHIIAETNRSQKPHSGFETGRVYSGLRGVVPVFATDPETGQRRHIGALEAGTSFANMIDILEDGTGSAFAVLLTREHVESTMWASAVQKLFGDTQLPCGCVVEATSRPGVLDIIYAYPFKASGKPAFDSPEIVEVGERTFAATFYPLRDFKARLEPGRDNVGSVLVWSDITDTIAGIERQQQINIAYALIGYLFLEVLLVLSFWAVTRHLEKTVAERTDELSLSIAREQSLNETLKHEINVKNRFFSIIAHDLRSPFNTLLGMTRLMRDLGHKADPQKVITFAGEVADAGERFFQLLQALLEWSGNQMENGDLTRTEFPLKRALQTVLDVYRPLAEEKRVAIIDDTPDIHVFGDEHLIATVLRNLVSNAIKFVEPNGRVVIAANSMPSHVEVSVTDSGAGVPEGLLDKLFSIDQKTTRPGTRGETGTGLGLPLCHDLITRHGGTIRVENLDGDEGTGARFTFTLPRAGVAGPD